LKDLGSFKTRGFTAAFIDTEPFLFRLLLFTESQKLEVRAAIEYRCSCSCQRKRGIFCTIFNYISASVWYEKCYILPLYKVQAAFKVEFIADSWANIARLRNSPHRYPPNAAVSLMTRWQGISHATSLLPTAEPTARAAFGSPIAEARRP
jgi:hypothetical protein